MSSPVGTSPDVIQELAGRDDVQELADKIDDDTKKVESSFFLLAELTTPKAMKSCCLRSNVYWNGDLIGMGRLCSCSPVLPLQAA